MWHRLSRDSETTHQRIEPPELAPCRHDRTGPKRESSGANHRYTRDPPYSFLTSPPIVRTSHRLGLLDSYRAIDILTLPHLFKMQQSFPATNEEYKTAAAIFAGGVSNFYLHDRYTKEADVLWQILGEGGTSALE